MNLLSQRLGSKAKKAVFRIQTTIMSSVGNTIGLTNGTGFPITNTGLLLTVAHIFHDRNIMRSIEIWAENESWSNGSNRSKYVMALSMQSIIFIDFEIDLVVLDMKCILDIRDQNIWALIETNEFPFFKLGHATELREGDDIVIAGWPRSCDGVVFTFGGLSTIDYFYGSKRRYRTDAAYNLGVSGGPVFHDELVIGVSSDQVMLVAHQSQAEQNGSLFIPAEDIVTFIQKYAPTMPANIRESLEDACP